MSTSNRTNLAVLIYEQTFTNVCVCVLRQIEHEEATTTRDIRRCDQTWRTGIVQVWCWVWRWSSETVAVGLLHRRRRNRTQTAGNMLLTLVINAIQTKKTLERLVLKMAVPLSRQMAHYESAHLSCFVIFVLRYVTLWLTIKCCDCQIMKALFACVLKCYFLCLLF